MFAATLLDPPWPESGGGQIKRGADRHYPLIRKKEHIYEVITSSGVFEPADDSHIYCWVTNNYLPWGLWLIDALGFRYVTNFPWHKKRMGIGQYGRGCHELVLYGEKAEDDCSCHELMLFGVRGRGYEVCTRHPDGRKVNNIRTDFLMDAEVPVNPRTGRPDHSRKPDRQYELVEKRTIGPYLEMFARRERAGWHQWGNELEGV